MPFCPTDLCPACGCCMEIACDTDPEGCHIERACGLCDEGFADGEDRVTLLDGDEYPFRAHKRCAA